MTLPPRFHPQKTTFPHTVPAQHAEKNNNHYLFEGAFSPAARKNL